jgi:ribose 5-phosphate isomerase B
VAPELNEFGILICGSGQGMALRANKYPKIRAALVYSSEIARLAREHNNANVICIGSRFCHLNEAKDWIDLFKSTHFLMGRHQSRVAKVSAPIA